VAKLAFFRIIIIFASFLYYGNSLSRKPRGSILIMQDPIMGTIYLPPILTTCLHKTCLANTRFTTGFTCRILYEFLDSKTDERGVYHESETQYTHTHTHTHTHIYIYIYIYIYVHTYTHTISVGKFEGKRPLERPRSSWKDIVEIDHKEMGFGLDSCDSGQSLVAGSCEHD
jgi:hypothetical protein